jgi:hypothetical protein
VSEQSSRQKIINDMERFNQESDLRADSQIDWQARALSAEQKVRSLEAENQCDICAGIGVSESGKPCACGGSGKMSDVAIYLRLKFFNEVKAREVAEQSLELSRAANVDEFRLLAEKWDRVGDHLPREISDAMKVCADQLRTLLSTLNKEEIKWPKHNPS